jgi:hypothetical protein
MGTTTPMPIRVSGAGTRSTQIFAINGSRSPRKALMPKTWVLRVLGTDLTAWVAYFYGQIFTSKVETMNR